MFIKTLFAFCCITVILFDPYITHVIAQVPSNYTDSLAKARVDLAVPDAPAFKLLNTEPSNIMRPSSPTDISVALGNFLLGGSTLPRAFAAEIAPGMLWGEPSLSAYQHNPFWYRSRVSLATQRNGDGTSDVAIGLRFTLIDKTDLRTDKQFEKQLIQLGNRLLDVQHECSKLADPFDTDFDKIYSHCVDSLAPTAYDQLIDSMRQVARRKNWNQPIVEIGLALAGTSKDSLAKNVKNSKAALWISAGFPFLKHSGQVIVGAKALLRKDTNNKFTKLDFSMAGRAYIGRYSYKGFTEFDLSHIDGMNALVTFSGGSELRVANGFWVDTSVGIQKEMGKKAGIITSINLRMSTPDVNK